MVLAAIMGCEEPQTTSTQPTAAPTAAAPATTTSPSPTGTNTTATNSTPLKIDFSAHATGAGSAITATANGKPIQLPFGQHAGAAGAGNTLPSRAAGQDPNGLWKYEMKSDSDGMSFKFELGSGSKGQAGGLAHPGASATPPGLAATTQRLQQLQAQAAARMAANPAPASASFHLDINLSADFDPDALMARFSGALANQMAAAAAGQPPSPTASAPVASGQGQAAANPLPLPSLATLSNAPLTPQQQAALLQDLWRALAANAGPAPTGRTTPTTTARAASATPGASAAPGADPSEAHERQEAADVAELYLWLAAEGELDGARELVTSQCQDGPVGRAEAVAFLGQSLEVLDADVTILELDGRSASASWELTALLPASIDSGEEADTAADRRSSVNLTGELQLVRDDGDWFVSCKD